MGRSLGYCLFHPGLCTHFWTAQHLPAHQALHGDSWWEMLIHSHRKLLGKCLGGLPSPGPATPDCALGCSSSRPFTAGSFLPGLLITLCPDCVIVYRMVLTASSLVCWPQVSLLPIPPPHNSYSNSSKTCAWLYYALALAAMAPLGKPLGETE